MYKKIALFFSVTIVSPCCGMQEPIGQDSLAHHLCAMMPKSGAVLHVYPHNRTKNKKTNPAPARIEITTCDNQVVPVPCPSDTPFNIIPNNDFAELSDASRRDTQNSDTSNNEFSDTCTTLSAILTGLKNDDRMTLDKTIDTTYEINSMAHEWFEESLRENDFHAAILFKNLIKDSNIFIKELNYLDKLD